MTAPRKDEPVITPAGDALSRLRGLAEAAVHGTCKVLSIGHACQCPLCDLDLVREDRARLLARIDQLKQDAAFHARCHTEAVNTAVKYEQSLSDSEARCRALEARIEQDTQTIASLEENVTELVQFQQDLVSRMVTPASSTVLATASSDAGSPQDRKWIEGAINRIVQDVAELPNRTSPDEWPEAMLVTSDELTLILEAQLSPQDRAEPQGKDRL